MKERSLLYFITAVIASVLFLVSILVRTQPWFINYGYLAMPSIYKLFIPVVLLWVGWYYQNKGLLLSATIIVSVLLGGFFDHVGVLTNDIFVLISFAPAVKTSFVLGMVLQLAIVGLGYFTYFKVNSK